ncbi:MAG: tetratricopeptide repeat protein [Bacteroidales bacterium]|nr:tetratricopeptide repeat protein [Bacteroidales bacterium]
MKLIAFIFISVIILFISSCTSNEIKIDIQKIDRLSISEMDSILKIDSTNAYLYRARAQQYINLNKIDNAIKDYKQAIKLQGDSLNWFVNLSDLYLLKGESENARQQLEVALKIDPNSTYALFKMGMLYLLIEDHLKSFEFFNQALSVDPNFAKAYFYKSINYIETGDTNRAIQELYKAIEKNPEYIDAYIQMGLYYDQINDTLARTFYKNAIRYDSLNAFAHYDLALHYQNHKEFSKAIDQYFYILNHIDSTFSTSYHNIGYIYLLYSNDLDTAIMYFDKAIAVDYNYSEAYTNKGYALELLKKYNDAFVEYQTAVKLDPQNTLAQEGLKRIKPHVKLN